MNHFFTNHDHPVGALFFEGEPEEKFIKVSFPEDGHFEHMWVRVESWTDLNGTLQQDPVQTSYVKDGDKVSFVKEAHRFLFTTKD